MNKDIKNGFMTGGNINVIGVYRYSRNDVTLILPEEVDYREYDLIGDYIVDSVNVNENIVTYRLRPTQGWESIRDTALNLTYTMHHYINDEEVSNYDYTKRVFSEGTIKDTDVTSIIYRFRATLRRKTYGPERADIVCSSTGGVSVVFRPGVIASEYELPDVIRLILTNDNVIHYRSHPPGENFDNLPGNPNINEVILNTDDNSYYYPLILQRRRV